MKLLGFLWLVSSRLVGVALLLAAALALAVKLRYGGGHTNFPDRTTAPRLPESALEIVAELPTPPGNIAVSADGRVFVTLHPEAHPEFKVVELVDGKPVPYPNAAFQDQRQDSGGFDNVLSIRIDRQNRLWALDNGSHGLHPGRLLAFDLASGKQVHKFTFPRDIAGLGSHLNDFQVSPDGAHLYIADASFFAKKPALIVYDVKRQQARRLLENQPSVRSEFYTPVVQGRTMEIFGILSIRPGVDSIALTRDGKYLAYAAITNRKLFAVATDALLDENLNARELARRVVGYGAKTMSDGITVDNAGNIYLSDPEHSAIVLLNPKRQLETLVKSEKLLRWPDGFSFGPDGWLYISNSSLHEVLGRTPAQIAAHAPYYVLRIKTGTTAPAGQ